jgi:4-hydroxy-tetrahydrodipicolinate reductase
MGTEAVATVLAASDLALAAVVDPSPVAGASVPHVRTIGELDAGLVDVVVDFTAADVARATLAWVARNAKDAVVGTSGLTDGDLEAVRAACSGGPSRILVVPNFSIGAVLVQRFAAQAAPYFESVEVIELHHAAKRDAPSGTSIATAEALAEARGRHGLGAPHDPTETTTIEGARGATGPGGIHVHSVRLPGLLAHEEVIFGGPGEGLTLRHDTYDRASFMGGLLLALRGLDRITGVVRGLESVLDS